MKVLFVQHMNGISGSELYLIQLLPELRKRGIEAEALIAYRKDTGKNKTFVDQLESRQVKVHQVYGYGPFSPGLLLQIKKLVKRERYDIVQSNLMHADLWMALIKLLFIRKMKLVSVKHGFNEKFAARFGFSPGKVNRSLSTWVQRFSGLMVNRNVTISRGLYDMYVKGKITKASKTEVIYYGLNLDHIPNNQPDKIVPERYAIILGRLEKYKGHEYVIRAWKKVCKANPGCKLYIVGGGSYEPVLVKLTKELGLCDHIIFKGYQPDPHELLHYSEFSIVSSVFEGFGLITLESWHHQKPVVAFDVPALNEIIDSGINGVLSPVRNSELLADRIIQLFTDREGTRQMGKQGYTKLQSIYSLKRMTDETAGLYNKIS